MWSLKFTVLNKDSIYTPLTQKYNVIDYLYPVDHFIKKGRIYILGIHILEGKEADKKQFIADLRKNKKVIELEENGDQIVTLIAEEERFYSLLFASELYHTAPVVIKEGYEKWHIAAFKRSLLENIVKEIEKWRNKLEEFDLLSLKRTDLSDIYFPKILPQIPEQQKKAFDLALKNGYYTWPRKAGLEKLAKIMGVSISTYQEHLRKAEAKLLPFFVK
ncbi:MAG: helix-turn-helix domain-containing protein [Nanoarchaeota archaeon]|nr:helix-turn-helix domain-containing protein [Nanoarchaeota archaeon]